MKEKIKEKRIYGHYVHCNLHLSLERLYDKIEILSSQRFTRIWVRVKTKINSDNRDSCHFLILMKKKVKVFPKILAIVRERLKKVKV